MCNIISTYERLWRKARRKLWQVHVQYKLTTHGNVLPLSDSKPLDIWSILTKRQYTVLRKSRSGIIVHVQCLFYYQRVYGM